MKKKKKKKKRRPPPPHPNKKQDKTNKQTKNHVNRNNTKSKNDLLNAGKAICTILEVVKINVSREQCPVGQPSGHTDD